MLQITVAAFKLNSGILSTTLICISPSHPDFYETESNDHTRRFILQHSRDVVNVANKLSIVF